MKKIGVVIVLMSLFAGPAAFAQDVEEQEYIGGIPANVYYIMPSFADGTVIFYGQTPAQGKLNICAVDNTLRFLDKDGKELVANGNQDIMRVRIDTVWFLRSRDLFFRMYPVTPDTGLAVNREVVVHKGAKEGAYGMVSYTSSIKQLDNVYADGVSVELNKGKKLAYEVSENLYLYRGNAVYPFNKKNLKKLFSAKTAEIDEYFKSHKSLPRTLDAALPLLAEWAETEH